MVSESLKEIITRSMTQMWPSLAIVCVALVCIRIEYFRTHSDHFHLYKEFWFLIGIIYLLLLYNLVTNVDFNTYHGGFNIVLFREITRYGFNSPQFYINVIGNILLFVPFGYIISSYIKPKNIWPSMVIAIIVSSTIELVQLKIGRSFDVDDILLNTLGCVIGFLFYVGWQAIARHLPDFLRSDWLKNLFCIIILGLLILSGLKAWGLI